MREPGAYCFYIMASRSRTLYCGVSGNLPVRVQQHKNHCFEGFSDNYNCERLVYFELYHEVLDAIAREKQIKRWSRAKKLRLIESRNPTWLDLSEDWGKSIRWLKLRPRVENNAGSSTRTPQAPKPGA